jgi:hypothetical protein
MKEDLFYTIFSYSSITIKMHMYDTCDFFFSLGHHFKAHKAVLAACSKFFYKFFQEFTQEPLVEIEGQCCLKYNTFYQMELVL